MAYEITRGMLDSFQLESIELQPGILPHDRLDFEIVLVHFNLEVAISTFITVTKKGGIIARSECYSDFSLSSYTRKDLRNIGKNIVEKLMEKYNGTFD